MELNSAKSACEKGEFALTKGALGVKIIIAEESKRKIMIYVNGACSFTGHRTIPPSHIGKLKVLLKRAINYAYERGCRRFYSGGAVGFDTLAARLVLEYRITHPDVKLVMYLPCTNQDKSWTARQRDAYEYVLKCADEVHYISDLYKPGCMKKRNELLADTCDIMIGYVGREGSGSAQTFRMAKKKGKEAYNLFSSVTEQDNNGLISIT